MKNSMLQVCTVRHMFKNAKDGFDEIVTCITLFYGFVKINLSEAKHFRKTRTYLC